MSDEEKGNKLFSAAGIGSSHDELAEGFLREYWSSKEPLPKLGRFGRYLYYIRQGFDTALSVPTSSVITVLTMALALFLLAGFILVLQNVSNALESAGGSLYASVYLKDSATVDELNVLKSELESNSNIRSLSYVSSEEALSQFKSDLGAENEFLKGLEEENPLPRSFELVFETSESSDLDDPTSSLNVSIGELREHPLVDDLVFGSEWINRLRDIIGAFRFFGLLGVFLMLGIVIFLISNTIKLVIYSRRDEISVMQLVGASDSFIKIPFLIGGILQGLIGSILGLSLLRIATAAINFELQNSKILGVSFSNFSFLPLWLVLTIAMVGVLVGAFGSLMSLGKFLNV